MMWIVQTAWNFSLCFCFLKRPVLQAHGTHPFQSVGRPCWTTALFCKSHFTSEKTQINLEMLLGICLCFHCKNISLTIPHVSKGFQQTSLKQNQNSKYAGTKFSHLWSKGQFSSRQKKKRSKHGQGANITLMNFPVRLAWEPEAPQLRAQFCCRHSAKPSYLNFLLLTPCSQGFPTQMTQGGVSTSVTEIKCAMLKLRGKKTQMSVAD